MNTSATAGGEVNGTVAEDQLADDEVGRRQRRRRLSLLAGYQPRVSILDTLYAAPKLDLPPANLEFEYKEILPRNAMPDLMKRTGTYSSIFPARVALQEEEFKASQVRHGLRAPSPAARERSPTVEPAKSPFALSPSERHRAGNRSSHSHFFDGSHPRGDATFRRAAHGVDFWDDANPSRPAEAPVTVETRRPLGSSDEAGRRSRSPAALDRARPADDHENATGDRRSPSGPPSSLVSSRHRKVTLVAEYPAAPSPAPAPARPRPSTAATPTGGQSSHTPGRPVLRERNGDAPRTTERPSQDERTTSQNEGPARERPLLPNEGRSSKRPPTQDQRAGGDKSHVVPPTRAATSSYVVTPDAGRRLPAQSALVAEPPDPTAVPFLMSPMSFKLGDGTLDGEPGAPLRAEHEPVSARRGATVHRPGRLFARTPAPRMHVPAPPEDLAPSRHAPPGAPSPRLTHLASPAARHPHHTAPPPPLRDPSPSSAADRDAAAYRRTRMDERGRPASRERDVRSGDPRDDYARNSRDGYARDSRDGYSRDYPERTRRDYDASDRDPRGRDRDYRDEDRTYRDGDYRDTRNGYGNDTRYDARAADTRRWDARDSNWEPGSREAYERWMGIADARDPRGAPPQRRRPEWVERHESARGGDGARGGARAEADAGSERSSASGASYMELYRARVAAGAT